MGGILSRIVMTCAMVLWPVASLAQEAAPVDRMMEAMRIADTIEVMREEGRRYGEDVANEMLPGADTDSWQKTVMRIHDPERMRRLIRQGFETALTKAEMLEVVAFYNGDPGAEIVALEVAARRAFLDPGIEEQARARHAAEDPEDSRLREQVDRMIADSDLIERNVAGAMNSTMMFYRGMMDGGELDMTQDDMLADLWSQEEAFRADSESWLGGFLLMAYDPLPEEDLDRYLSFWQSDAGRALNSGLFMAFDRMYEELSYLMGQAVAQHMQSEKL
ncbi:DUF2059 domain-containing protein [Roseovarius sp. A21]|uniref:DUF2059 domain-containing protein n=1 Tax=Roseovarius bejariae TaxID=2576383 RepID=A0A844CFC0_9RHOB|nr:DUF2059 domain-containing protein [Roseovarius bejariae]MRU13951.1 DUF2059 domain-containing protein [Roseovarius bejariae]